MSKGFTYAAATDDGERMAQVSDYAAEHRRLLFRRKGFLAGWSVLSDCVGSCNHHKGTMKLVASMIEEDGDSPDDFEFRIDYAPPVKWIEGEIIDGASLRNRQKKSEVAL